jgi:hypothetical protein
MSEAAWRLRRPDYRGRHGHFSDVMLTKDLNPLEPKYLEYKQYARGVGPIQAITVSGGTDREELLSYKPGRS